MLLQPRLFAQSQLPSLASPPSSHDHDDHHTHNRPSDLPFFQRTETLHQLKTDERKARKMLLLHQSGSVKIGQVVRYTLTYTPSNDRILPTPKQLHLKIKNTSPIPLRAAYLHGPYTLHVSAYPRTFDPHRKAEPGVDGDEGTPEFEPMLKAGGYWTSALKVPEGIRETGASFAQQGGRRQSSQVPQSGAGADGGEDKGSVTWIIEIASQILFSTSANVHFEVLVGRDERSLDLGFAAVAGHGQGGPGKLEDHYGSAGARRKSRVEGNRQKAGVYSHAVKLVAEDTEALWEKPGMPTWEAPGEGEGDGKHGGNGGKEAGDGGPRKRRKKKVHLVVLTHGLHSNLGADMLFLKESIDATVKQARVDAKKRKASYRQKEAEKKQGSSADAEAVNEHDNEMKSQPSTSTAPLSGGQEDLPGELAREEEDEDNEEEVIVRGFNGNAVRTENGIQYLGKRLAKWVLKFTYPDQPFYPVKKPLSQTISDSFRTAADKQHRDGAQAHQGSSVHSSQSKEAADRLPYTFTSISFIGHSLGGLVQTYAIAYIHKHAPHFFETITPVNFICMASPMLGLSNENPMYVKFALDWRLVGRTGQDLGLTWRPPTLAKGGWNAMIGGFGGNGKGDGQAEEDPTAKPLLRILPTGPAHQILKKFRNKTVYSNVVNDGIVPLRTSCLLFLDWRGLGKVDKARRGNGLIGTMAEWGWAEITGANSSSMPPQMLSERSNDYEDSDNEHVRKGEGETVPQPGGDVTAEDNFESQRRLSVQVGDPERNGSASSKPSTASSLAKKQNPPPQKGLFDNFLEFFRPAQSQEQQKAPQPNKKSRRALRRGQTVHPGDDDLPDDIARSREGTTSNPVMRPHHHASEHIQNAKSKRPMATRGDTQLNDPDGAHAPPRTTIFESAGDILHPPIPSKLWITDPGSRLRTIFHDRVYHPEDIPPPPAKRPGSRLTRAFSSESMSKSSNSAASNSALHSQPSADAGAMSVEEKIARAYHRDLSWRKVLVRLEPDAHNNMVVRRMFANAYGWPVVKHLCDTHFADTHTARTRDDLDTTDERATEAMDDAPIASREEGEEVANQNASSPPAPRSKSEMREAVDELSDLSVVQDGTGSVTSKTSTSTRRQLHRANTTQSVGSVEWDYLLDNDDNYDYDGSDADSDDVDERNVVSRFLNPMEKTAKLPEQPVSTARPEKRLSARCTGPSSPGGAADFHRGLGPSSPSAGRARGGSSGSGSGSGGVPERHAKTRTPSGSVDQGLVEEPEPLGGLSQHFAGTAEVGLSKSRGERISSSASGGKRKSISAEVAGEIARRGSVEEGGRG